MLDKINAQETYEQAVQRLVEQYPPVDSETGQAPETIQDGTRLVYNALAIPPEAVVSLAELCTMFVADAIQQWIDAGSERECTIEDLGGHMQLEVLGWTYHPLNGPVADGQTQVAMDQGRKSAWGNIVYEAAEKQLSLYAQYEANPVGHPALDGPPEGWDGSGPLT